MIQRTAASGNLLPEAPCAPPRRRALTVLASERLGRYRLLSLQDPDAAQPAPGQFAMIAAADNWGGGEDERPYLARALSYARHDGQSAQFLLAEVGPGTRRLAALAPGQQALLLGPLGRPFSLAAPGMRVASSIADGPPQPLLVGGGVGMAPLLFLHDALRPLPALKPALSLLGFRDSADAAAAELIPGARIATDDGSRGLHGNALQLLEAALAELDGQERRLRIFACGPPALLEGVRALCGRRRLSCQLALEAPMACGYGACHGCILPSAAGGYLRACIDGPVIDAALLGSLRPLDGG